MQSSPDLNESLHVHTPLIESVKLGAFMEDASTATANMALGYSSTRTRTALTIVFDSDRTSGNVTMSLTATQTAALEAPARYVYDLDITDSSGTVTRIIEGLITTRPNV